MEDTEMIDENYDPSEFLLQGKYHFQAMDEDAAAPAMEVDEAGAVEDGPSPHQTSVQDNVISTDLAVSESEEEADGGHLPDLQDTPEKDEEDLWF